MVNGCRSLVVKHIHFNTYLNVLNEHELGMITKEVVSKLKHNVVYVYLQFHRSIIPVYQRIELNCSCQKQYRAFRFERICWKGIIVHQIQGQ